MTLKIKYGNLIKEPSIFTVNASNMELILGSGVSKAFREQCGGSFYQQKRYEIKERIGKIEQGDVILTDSGLAPNFRYALHVAVMNYTDDTKPASPTYVQIKKALGSMLKIIKETASEEEIEKPEVVIYLHDKMDYLHFKMKEFKDRKQLT